MNTTFIEEFFFHFNSPLGLIAICYTDNPFMLTKVVLPGKNASARCFGGSFRQPQGNSTDRINGFMDAYFNKQPASVPWDLLKFERFTLLQRLVWKQTAKISFGTLCTYGEIAQAVGRPGAARFAGTALGKNPYPIIIPCHRIIRKDGGMGGFGSGLEIKHKLLIHEGSIAKPFL